MHLRVGEGGEIKPQLTGPQRGAAGEVGEEAQLLRLDAVLHVAAGAIQVLVQAFGVGAVRAEVGDHEPRVRPFGQALRLPHHPLGPGPALAHAVAEVPIPARRLTGSARLRLGLMEISLTIPCASASFKIETICVSVNRLLLIGVYSQGYPARKL